MDPGSLDASKGDAISASFYGEKDKMAMLDNTKSPDQITSSDYQIIFYDGGYGSMYDLPSNEAIAKLGADIYQNDGIVGSVSHGTVGLVPIKLKNGDSILKGQAVTSSTNAEETTVELVKVMPFALETRLVEMRAKFVGGSDWGANVQESGRIVTGQNPASASPTAKAIVTLLKKG